MEQIRQLLQEGSSLHGVSRITSLAYNTIVSIIRAGSQRAQLVHNTEVQAIETEEVSAGEMWSLVEKNEGNVYRMNSKPGAAG